MRGTPNSLDTIKETARDYPLTYSFRQNLLHNLQESKDTTLSKTDKIPVHVGFTSGKDTGRDWA